MCATLTDIVCGWPRACVNAHHFQPFNSVNACTSSASSSPSRKRLRLSATARPRWKQSTTCACSTHASPTAETYAFIARQKSAVGESITDSALSHRQSLQHEDLHEFCVAVGTLCFKTQLVAPKQRMFCGLVRCALATPTAAHTLRVPKVTAHVVGDSANSSGKRTHPRYHSQVIARVG